MGIYDRDYYRREGPSFLGAITSTGQVCKWLIVVNAVVFVIQLLSRPATPQDVRLDWHLQERIREELQLSPREWQLLQEDRLELTPQQKIQLAKILEERGRKRHFATFTDAFMLYPQAVLQGQLWRLLTYAFLHDPNGILHILFNMLFLWWFGSDLELLYGSREFLIFYLASAVVGGLAYFTWGVVSAASTPCLGASGAVTAVMVLFALHYPTRLIYIWFVLPVPIWLFVLFQVAQDTFIFASGRETGTAVTVHLGGAALGALYYKMGWRLSNLLPDLRSWQRRRGRPRLRIYRDDDEERSAPVSVAAAPPSGEADEQFKARVDAVLEKMTRHGKESLTESEKQLLQRASELYRRRRH